MWFFLFEKKNTEMFLEVEMPSSPLVVCRIWGELVQNTNGFQPKLQTCYWQHQNTWLVTSISSFGKKLTLNYKYCQIKAKWMAKTPSLYWCSGFFIDVKDLWYWNFSKETTTQIEDLNPHFYGKTVLYSLIRKKDFFFGIWVS